VTAGNHEHEQRDPPTVQYHTATGEISQLERVVEADRVDSNPESRGHWTDPLIHNQLNSALTQWGQ